MTEPAMPPYADVLGDVLPARPRPRRAGTLAVAGLMAAVLGVGGAGVVTAVALSGGGGPQPEDVLPAGAIAFVKVDLDPSAGQKLNIFTLSRKFPEAAERLRSADSLRDDVLRLALEDSGTGLDYDRDVKPWIGDRVGVAVFPSTDDGPDAAPEVVAAVAHTDRAKAEQALTKASADSDEPLEFVLTDDYALLGDDADVLRSAAAATDHLADDEAYEKGVAALDGDQVALAWADVSRVWEAVPAEIREQAATAPGSEGLDPSGQVVVGVSVERDAVEVLGRTVDVTTGVASQDALTTGKGTGLVGDLPAKAIGAVSISGLGEALAKSYDGLLSSLEAVAPDLEAQAEELGLELPEDLVTVLGQETAVGAWGDGDSPEVLVRSRNDEADEAVGILRRLYDGNGGAELGEEFDDVVQEVDGGYVAGTPGAVAGAETGERLGDRADFRAAVPDADSAGVVVWVSLRDVLGLVGGEPDPNTDALGALGITSTGGADGEFRIRLTFR